MIQREHVLQSAVFAQNALVLQSRHDALEIFNICDEEMQHVENNAHTSSGNKVPRAKPSFRNDRPSKLYIKYSRL